MKIALAQMAMASDIAVNYEKSIRQIREAAEQEADMICFPEIQLSPFFPQHEKRDVSAWLMTEDDPCIAGICEACRAAGIHAATNFYVRENGKPYDMSLLIDDTGAIIGRQKMVHVAQCVQFYEQDYYTPSEDGFRVFDTRLGRIGIVVCFDRHYPESIRTEALRGADLIVVPTANTVQEPSEMFQWEIKVQAFQNSVNIAMCNRVGIEDDMVFSGESIVADCNGNTIALAGSSEELLIAEIDLPAAAKARASKSYTTLRRTELYE